MNIHGPLMMFVSMAQNGTRKNVYDSLCGSLGCNIHGEGVVPSNFYYVYHRSRPPAASEAASVSGADSAREAAAASFWDQAGTAAGRGRRRRRT